MKNNDVVLILIEYYVVIAIIFHGTFYLVVVSFLTPIACLCVIGMIFVVQQDNIAVSLLMQYLNCNC